jgi:predicted deacylase
VLDAPPVAAGKKSYAVAQKLAGQTGMVVVVEATAVPRSLSNSLIERGIPALTLELGEAMAVVEHNVALGLESVWRVFCSIGLTDPAPVPVEIGVPEPARNRTLVYSSRPYSSTSGVIRFLCQPGDFVRRDQPVAQIYNAFGKLQETIRAAADAVVLGRNDSSVAFPGAPIMAFGELP